MYPQLLCPPKVGLGPAVTMSKGEGSGASHSKHVLCGITMSTPAYVVQATQAFPSRSDPCPFTNASLTSNIYTLISSPQHANKCIGYSALSGSRGIFKRQIRPLLMRVLLEAGYVRTWVPTACHISTRCRRNTIEVCVRVYRHGKED